MLPAAPRRAGRLGCSEAPGGQLRSPALVAAPVSACSEVPASAAPPGFSLSCGFAGVRAPEILVLCGCAFSVSCLRKKQSFIWLY